MRESRIEKHLVERVRQTGGFTRKVQWIGHRGAPDRFCGWLHRFAFVELKRPLTPKAEAHQLREHENLRSTGIQVWVLASIEDVDRFIEEVLR